MTKLNSSFSRYSNAPSVPAQSLSKASRKESLVNEIADKIIILKLIAKKEEILL
jgi:hypothetical protein